MLRSVLPFLDVEEVKTVPEVSLSHLFVERLTETAWREFLDQASIRHPHLRIWTRLPKRAR